MLPLRNRYQRYMLVPSKTLPRPHRFTISLHYILFIGIKYAISSFFTVSHIFTTRSLRYMRSRLRGNMYISFVGEGGGATSRWRARGDQQLRGFCCRSLLCHVFCLSRDGLSTFVEILQIKSECAFRVTIPPISFNVGGHVAPPPSACLAEQFSRGGGAPSNPRGLPGITRQRVGLPLKIFLLNSLLLLLRPAAFPHRTHEPTPQTLASRPTRT